MSEQCGAKIFATSWKGPFKIQDEKEHLNKILLELDEKINVKSAELAEHINEYCDNASLDEPELDLNNDTDV
ncbi:13972_t:CDS:2 [Funneliformis caledonium]|uniref:13972_t:CDS:1 n=1 Tax=Funneliformis caledonium TaxID=1117310 RepID=A0A9N9GF88_9GLOM|nr:13972_t:CDS:2 [Funneliformis caledonium]